jgi:hypothetical protein
MGIGIGIGIGIGMGMGMGMGMGNLISRRTHLEQGRVFGYIVFSNEIFGHWLLLFKLLLSPLSQGAIKTERFYKYAVHVIRKG